MNRTEILKRAVDTYGRQMQEDICIEEMSELTKALIKCRRVKQGYGRPEASERNVIEEIADVQIMLDQMRLICGGTSVEERFELKRLEERLNDGNG